MGDNDFGGHRWMFADKNGVRGCMNTGCTIRWWAAGGAWQAKFRAQWFHTTVPQCAHAKKEET